MTTQTLHGSNKGNMNSVQLNLVTFVNVYQALASGSLEKNVYMMDNCFESSGKGTTELQTVCKPGQALNWIIYPLDMNQRVDGAWPPMVKINNIVFLEGNGEYVLDHKVCEGFKVYGPPDEIRSPNTPVYYYWAGMVLPDLPPGVYKYRLILELDPSSGKSPVYLNLDTPSLKVIPVEEASSGKAVPRVAPAGGGGQSVEEKPAA